MRRKDYGTMAKMANSQFQELGHREEYDNVLPNKA